MPTRIALVGAGGKMGLRIAEKIRNLEEYEVLYVQREGPGLRRLEARGLRATTQRDALASADVAILAIPDSAIGGASPQIVAALAPGALVIGLDPAAAHAQVMPIRDDLGYFVAHPCHPPLFGDEVTEEARNDHFGGVHARQHIVCALHHGPESDYARGERIARAIYAPVMNAYRLTVEQMAILEPALVETLGVTVLTVIRDALEKSIEMGVPEEAARAFLFGHLQIAIAQVFGFVDYPMSDGARLAVARAYPRIFRSDWMANVMNPARIAESVADITHKGR